MILTYDPSTVVIIVGTIPITDWVSCRAIVPDKRDFLTGKDGEMTRVKYQGNKMASFQLILSQGSHFNLGLTTMEKLDLPIPVRIMERRLFESSGADAAVLTSMTLGLPATDITMISSQLFLYPATFIRTPDIGYEKSQSNVEWLLKGYVRINYKSGLYTDLM